MLIPKLPFTLQEIKKYPMAVVLSLLLSHFVWVQFIAKSDKEAECEEKDKRIISIEAQLETSQKENKELVTALLVKNGIIGAIKTSVADSTKKTNDK